MIDANKHYPNLTWAQFAVCNDDATGAFEDMSRRLFSLEFLEKGVVLHSDHNNPGIEVLPILERVHSDGSKQRKISFQAKYFENEASFAKIKDSMNQAIKHYGDELDLIYLFCNKTLTTTSKGYKDIVALLEKAGIELAVISNKEVLDLVANHTEIASYFFMPRKRPDDVQIDLTHTGIIVNTDDNSGCNYYLVRASEQVIDPRLIKNYVQEKIQICQSLILEIRFDKLREEIEEIFTYKLTGVEGTETLLFYKAVLELREGKEIKISVDGLTEQDKIELSWMEAYYKNPVPISIYTFASHRIESQVIVLDKMFSSQLWNAVTVLCKEIVDDGSSKIIDTVKQYYGLALFNLQKYDLASDILKALYQKNSTENNCVYSVFAEIKNINDIWRQGNYGYRERLKELIKQLELLKDNKQYKHNISLVAMLYLESAYNLGIDEKEYVEKAIERYQEFSEDVKNEKGVKYLYALCQELNGNIEIAESIYEGLDWKNDATIAYKYLICKLSRNNYAEVIGAYNNIVPCVINTKLKSLYLTAVYYEDNGAYPNQLKKILSEVQDDLEGIIDIAVGVNEKKCLEDNIIPLVKKYLDAEVNKLAFIQKMDLLLILSRAGELEIILAILRNMQDVEALNRYVMRQIYEASFVVSNGEFINHDKALIKTEKLESAELIADIFLKANVSRKEFLQIKYLCAGAEEKKISMLKYAKELFEITNEEGWARIIVAMLFERNETDFKAYAPYITVLGNSTKPEHCMAVAFAMLRLGKTDEADLYVYKALYYLNGVDNYEIYKNYLAYYNQNLNRYHDGEKLKKVKNNCVVTLKENISDNFRKSKVITVCLDSEREFSDPNNMSMGIKHIPNSSSLYLKIQGSSLNQILKIRGSSYRVVNIQSRANFAMGFIFRKIDEHSEKFDGAVFVLSAEKLEDLVDKLKSVMDKTEQNEKMLNFYHFKENEIGLPIDSFTNGDYDRYIDALTMLLYAKNQAFYTGYPTYENEENQRYVPMLSTLVLLSSMNILSVLEKIKHNLILPASYMDFLAERYRKAKEMSSVSAGKLVNANNQLTLVKNDEFHVEIWERIIDFCTECKKENISDDDRIEFSIGDINGEELIAATCLHVIQLDSLVLAKKEQATLLSDDLFFRKLAIYGEIKNINFVSLLWHYDKDFVVPIIMELSKTNYLYIPLIARTDEEAIQLKKNILDGEMKKKFYSEMLIAYKIAWENAMRERFGENIEFDENA